MIKKLLASFLAGTTIASFVGCGRPMPPDERYAPNLSRAEEIRTAFIGGGGATAEESGGGSSAQPTGWATLTGVFTLDGPAPPRTPLSVTKDANICAPGGNAPLSEELVVAGDGGVRDVLIFLNDAISPEEPWTHPSAAPGKSDEVVFDQKECVFLSHVLAMQASQPLKILNSDPTAHNTKMEPKANPPFNQNIGAGGEILTQLPREEKAPFPVSCSVHPWMNAYIMVRDNGYFAVSADDGSFEIANLPAGVPLEFRVWQAAISFVQDVSVNGESAKWSKGRFTITLDPNDPSKNRLEVKVKSPS
ncbi:MAG: hypothetical protein KDA60_11950 [Planctomycetales bacterium]|nr:hypothetical protein [Planctomycetales bacterium]